MFFLNLTAGEFLTLLGAVSGLVTALYLLDRTRRKKVVSTLRFWNPAFAAEQTQSRKRVREPWSLILQLISLLLLLLAIAQLQWGTQEGKGRDHVILLDTSSWTAQAGQGGSVIAREKTVAQQYLATLPGRDRVMLARSDALSAPATPFTVDRQQTVRAIAESVPSYSALNIGQALSFANQARTWSGGATGEIVYIGPKLVDSSAVGNEIASLKLDNVRVIDVPATLENTGIRGMAVKRGEDEPNSWQASVTLKNYGATRRPIELHAQFAGTLFAPRMLSLRAGQETTVQFGFVTNTAGRFSATITPHDDLPADDQASLELPASGLLRVVVYTSRPGLLRPLLEANRQLLVKFSPLAAYVPKPAADLMLLDQFAPPRQASNRPEVPSLWIDPPPQDPPIPMKSVVNNAAIKSWQADGSLDAGLHAKETLILHAEVFETFEGDQAVASVAEGPVVVARSGNNKLPKEAVVGFDPLSGPMRFEVTTPLLFANLLRWLSPESFRSVEITAGRVGTATVNLDKSEKVSSLHVTDERGFAVPFTVHDQSLELFASRPSIVRIVSEDHDRVLSLTLPDIAETQWKPSNDISTGVPASHFFGSTSTDLWRWLAVLGGLGLLAEWVLFGRRRLLNWKRSGTAAPAPASAAAPPRELVSK